MKLRGLCHKSCVSHIRALRNEDFSSNTRELSYLLPWRRCVRRGGRIPEREAFAHVDSENKQHMYDGRSDAEADLASQNPAPNELPPAEAADDAAKSDVGDGQLNSPAMGVATV